MAVRDLPPAAGVLQPAYRLLRRHALPGGRLDQEPKGLADETAGAAGRGQETGRDVPDPARQEGGLAEGADPDFDHPHGDGGDRGRAGERPARTHPPAGEHPGGEEFVHPGVAQQHLRGDGFGRPQPHLDPQGVRQGETADRICLSARALRSGGARDCLLLAGVGRTRGGGADHTDSAERRDRAGK